MAAAAAGFFLAAFVSSSFAAGPVSHEKEIEIRRTLELTGVKKLMEQIKSQMIAQMRSDMKEVLPDEFWTKIEKKMDVSELIEKLIPLYDKYYSLEDLRALNKFYASDVGQRVIATAPKIMKESMAIGMEWGKRIGEEAEREARAEHEKEKSDK